MSKPNSNEVVKQQNQPWLSPDAKSDAHTDGFFSPAMSDDAEAQLKADLKAADDLKRAVELRAEKAKPLAPAPTHMIKK